MILRTKSHLAEKHAFQHPLAVHVPLRPLIVVIGLGRDRREVEPISKSHPAANARARGAPHVISTVAIVTQILGNTSLTSTCMLHFASTSVLQSAEATFGVWRFRSEKDLYREKPLVQMLQHLQAGLEQGG